VLYPGLLCIDERYYSQQQHGNVITSADEIRVKEAAWFVNKLSQVKGSKHGGNEQL
jgi:hypothetical protein